MESLSSQTFLITGAHGFIGAWIVKRLLESDARVVIFDRSGNAQRLNLIMTAEQVSRTHFEDGDITEAGALLPIIEKFGVTNLIHLAGLQVPTCRAEPVRGATVNVLGTLNVFAAARQSAGQIDKVVYASSAAVFGGTEDERPMTETDEPLPNTHYGVFKRCNEGNARVYFLDHGINSIGLRPLTIYGVGRDVGITSDPTKAMKAAVKGRPFHIRFGGRTDFQYVADTADIFINASISKLTGAHVFNLHGETIHVRDVVHEIERAAPEASGSITFAETPLPIPPEMDDTAIRAALGPQPSTPLAEGVAATISHFKELERQGVLDASDLDN
ncbi:MAG TPA: NAD(P)-dependent oxidoreductase [Pyrinomonadaceae bacterium]|nr:NAD(P)-dependent oxidoreductase [Pyrinomonadaceae bacterium]